MSVTCLHLNSTLFPKPEKFTPDRWLGPRSHGLNQYLVPFSKGPRMCLGIKYVCSSQQKKQRLILSLNISIAWAELYLIFGHIFRRLEMEMVGTRYAIDFLRLIIKLLQPDLVQVSMTFVDSRIILFPFTREGSYIFVPSKHFIENCLSLARALFTLPYKNVLEYSVT